MSEFSLNDLDKVLAELQAPSSGNEKRETSINLNGSNLNEDLDSLLADLDKTTRTIPSQPTQTTINEPQKISNPSTTISVTSSTTERTSTSEPVKTTLPHENRSSNELDDLLEELDGLPKRSYIPPSSDSKPQVTQTVSLNTQTTVTTPTLSSNTTPVQSSSSQTTTSSSSDLDDLLLDLPKRRTYNTLNTPSNTSTTTTTTTHTTTTTKPTTTVSTSSSSTSTNSDEKICARCGNSVTSSYILALDKYWCKDHFNCSRCQGSIAGNFFDTPDGICCESCAKSQFQCSICKQPIKDLYLVFENGNKVHRECVPREKCEKCNNQINLGQSYTEAVGKYWHNECFTCTMCSVSLGTTFIQFEEKPYCKTCISVLSKDRNIKIE